MEQIVERQKRSTFKTFLVIIGFVILIDFIIFIMNRYVEDLSPYIANIAIIFLVVISCSFILIKYFSKYSYIIEEGQLIFYRVIGKRRFEILRIDRLNLIYIRPYKDEKYTYNFTFDKKGKEVYIGGFIDNNRRMNFLFNPNEQILKGLKKMLKNKE
ncbi:hypothetical protein CULT_650039 [[Clostridium] ultunense Esp]|uniref:DUF304 domain-containing protein n=1 Tax=[Clostridium] ultunense Esp TaxID=1288971 RepID=M1ZGH4_9FIRM|nr:hypothetical protein [Schnuerera ultunensis]CCQ97534.1 hypothetical protein CULT_650039 [[Clostridium] ultunense Esp]SHD76140.1 conserved protein of unknown function [[Clostridium] ultunense Esp]